MSFHGTDFIIYFIIQKYGARKFDKQSSKRGLFTWFNISLSLRFVTYFKWVSIQSFLHLINWTDRRVHKHIVGGKERLLKS